MTTPKHLAKLLDGETLHFDSPHGAFAFASSREGLERCHVEGIAAFSPNETETYIAAARGGLMDDPARAAVLLLKRFFAAKIVEVKPWDQQTTFAPTTKRDHRRSHRRSAQPARSETSAKPSGAQTRLKLRGGR